MAGLGRQTPCCIDPPPGGNVSRTLPPPVHRFFRDGGGPCRAGEIRLPPPPPPVLFLDVMDTLVVDPFYVDMYAHFGFSSQAAFLAAKHPTTWVDWERGTIGSADAFARFFADRRPVDAAAFTAYLRSAYALLPGVEGLLDDLAGGGVSLHVLSNYTDLWREVEAAVGLGARWGVSWTAVSCMTGARKPEVGAYVAAAEAAGVDPASCVLVDDRQANVEAAVAAGFGGGVTAVKGGGIDDVRAALREWYPWL